MKEFIKKHPALTELVVKITVFLLMLLITFGYIIGVATQDSDSMLPNIKFHDVVIYSKLNSDYTLRDVVVYEVNGELFIGRLVGTPNNSIYVTQSGSVFHNNYLNKLQINEKHPLYLNHPVYYPKYMNNHHIHFLYYKKY